MATSLTSPEAVFLGDKALIEARSAVSRVSQFATNFSSAAAQPGSTLKIPVFKSTGANTFDPESKNYAYTGGSVTYAEVTFRHVVSNFTFSDTDFLEAGGMGFWEAAGEVAGGDIVRAIEKSVGDLLTAAAMPKTKAVENGTRASIGAVRAQAIKNGLDPNHCVLLLNPDLYSDLLVDLPANTLGSQDAIADGVIKKLLGFKAVVEFAHFADAAGTLGAVIPEDGIAIAGRIVTAQSTAAYEDIGVSTDEKSGLSLGIRRWGNPANGLNYINVESCYGATLVQGTKALRLTKGA